MGMRRKHNLRLARIIQWISGGLAIIVIYPVFRLIYPCWRRIRGTGKLGEAGVPRSSASTHSSESSYTPSGKPVPQDK